MVSTHLADRWSRASGTLESCAPWTRTCSRCQRWLEGSVAAIWKDVRWWRLVLREKGEGRNKKKKKTKKKKKLKLTECPFLRHPKQVWGKGEEKLKKKRKKKYRKCFNNTTHTYDQPCSAHASCHLSVCPFGTCCLACCLACSGDCEERAELAVRFTVVRRRRKRFVCSFLNLCDAPLSFCWAGKGEKDNKKKEKKKGKQIRCVENKKK